EHAVEPEQHGEERGDPDQPRSEPRQQYLVRPQSEGHDGGDHDEEQHQGEGLAAGAEGQFHVAADDGGKGAHAAVPSSMVRSGPFTARSWWVAAMTMPSALRCAPISSATSPSPWLSRAEVGSSSSQTGLWLTSSRASARRRSWPVD